MDVGVLVPGKKYSETGVRKVYGKKSLRIYHKFTTRIPDTCCLEQVPWVQRLWILGKFKGLFSILGEDGEVLKRWKA